MVKIKTKTVFGRLAEMSIKDIEEGINNLRIEQFKNIENIGYKRAIKDINRIIEEKQKQNSIYLNQVVDMEIRRGKYGRAMDLKRREALIKIWKAIIDYTKELILEIEKANENNS